MWLGNGNRLCCFVFFALLLFTQAAYALKLAPEASAGLKYSNNVLLQEANEKSSLVYTGLMGISIEEHSKLFSLTANTSIRSESYANSEINVDDKYYFNLGLSTKMDVIQRRLSFQLGNNFKQTIIDTSTPRVPDNIQDTNVFTFGSDIRIPLTPRQQLVLMPRYRKFYYETTDADNKQYSSTASWIYTLSPLTKLSLNGGITKVFYDDNSVVDSDYVSNNVNLGITRKLKRSNINIRLGVTNIQKDGQKDQNGHTGSLRWVRDLTSKSNISLTIKSELRDSSQSLVGFLGDIELDESLDDLESEEITRDILISNSVRAEYNGRKSIMGFKVWGSFNDLDYKASPRDRELRSAGFQFNYPVMRMLNTTVYGSYRVTKEIDLLREERLRTLGVSANYRLARSLSCSFKLQNVDNQSDVNIYEYDEISVYAGIVYGKAKR
jgi:hypothetical protein